ncbi:hypothetical protein L9F63_012456 [Diploptera punctata]|uniref:N-acetyltransferase domain-containing protein n=1 Tax=Diploptera punctata TaxID=6984 RepID=A0AAD8ACF0_DIPPU|nr:hypothetical protein L9F63_012456 [Diploptera punctata]
MSDRVWAESEDGKFKWVSLIPKYLSQTIEVYRKSFYVNENISKVTEISKTEKGMTQFDEFLIEIAQDGVSVICVETSTDKVVGAGINKLQDVHCSETPILQKYFSREDLDPGFKELLNFMIQLEAKVDVADYYQIDSFMDHMFLATHPDYYRKGIGLKTVDASVEIAKALYKGEDVAVPISEDKYPWKKTPIPRPQVVIALFTSPLSQKIGKNLGWDFVTEVSYEDLIYEGKTYASRLDKNNNCSLYMGIRLS